VPIASSHLTRRPSTGLAGPCAPMKRSSSLRLTVC
jgi:hypothetical protein